MPLPIVSNILTGLGGDGSEVPTNMMTLEISERDPKLDEGYALPIDMSQSACVIDQSSNDERPGHTNSTRQPSARNNSGRPRPFPTILKMVVNSTKANPFDSDSEDDIDPNNDIHTNRRSEVPTMIETLATAKRKYGIQLDDKQLLAYQMICASFMIKIIQEGSENTRLSERTQDQTNTVNEVIAMLKSMGGKEQLILFLTGPAGAGKTTAIKLAQKFCEKFSEACRIPFDQYSFYFTAYTGAAASDSGGITTLTAMQIPLYGDVGEPSQHTITTLNKVKILIIDEISFMTVKQLQKISKRLQELFNCTVPFGGMSVIFSGDFRQLEQGQTSEKELLYTIQSGMYFENLLNAALILENDHRFKEDPEFGRMLTDMWYDDLSTKQKVELNKRVVMDKSKLPQALDDDCFYACPTNIHRNIISANNFRKHILATHR